MSARRLAYITARNADAPPGMTLADFMSKRINDFVSAQDAKASIDAMSRENDTTGTTGPWYAALRALTASDRRDVAEDTIALLVAADFLLVDGESPSIMDEHPRRSFVEAFSDGDRPADLTDSKIDDAATWLPEHRHRCRTRDGKALVWREMMHDRGRGDGYAASVRETHPTVHRALSDDETTGPTIRGCKWCVSGQ